MAKLSHNFIYSFKYPTPVSPVKQWDLNPLAVLLHQDSLNVLMINLHWLPSNRLRAKFLEFIIDSSRRISARRLIKIVYGMLDAIPVRGIKEFAIRKYRRNKMRNIIKISKSDLLRLDTSTRFNMAKLNRFYPKKKIMRRK